MNIDQLIENSEKSLTETFKKIDSVALYNQEKVLSAFKKERVALRATATTISGATRSENSTPTFFTPKAR